MSHFQFTASSAGGVMNGLAKTLPETTTSRSHFSLNLKSCLIAFQGQEIFNKEILLTVTIPIELLICVTATWFLVQADQSIVAIATGPMAQKAAKTATPL